MIKQNKVQSNLNNLLVKYPFFPTMLGYSVPTFSNVPVPAHVGNGHLCN